MAGCQGNAELISGENSYADGMVLPDLVPIVLREGEKLKVIATTSIIGDVVSNVGGGAIDLAVLMEPGQDPHSYEPAPGDLAAIERGDLIFVNGMGLEEVLLDIIRKTTSAAVVPVSAGIKPIAIAEYGHDESEHTEKAETMQGEFTGDPHFWTDPNQVMVWVDNIKSVLIQINPENIDT